MDTKEKLAAINKLLQQHVNYAMNIATTEAKVNAHRRKIARKINNLSDDFFIVRKRGE